MAISREWRVTKFTSNRFSLSKYLIILFESYLFLCCWTVFDRLSSIISMEVHISKVLCTDYAPPSKLGGISFIVQTCINQFPARSDLMNHLRMSILSIYCIPIRAVLFLFMLLLHLCFRASDHPEEFTVHHSHQSGQQYHLPDSPYYCHTHSLDWQQYLHTHP